MNKNKVSLPTVTGLKLFQGSVMATLYLKTGSWSAVRSWAVNENIFDTNRTETSARYASHVIKMISTLNQEQLHILSEGDSSEQLAMLWLGFCRTFDVVGWFAKEIIHEKYVSKDFNLTRNDFMAFLISKSDSVPELKEIGASSRSKLQSVVFHNLGEAGFISSTGEIQTAMLSYSVLRSLDEGEIAFFPFQEVYA